MKRLSYTKQLENCLLALMLWDKVNPRLVNLERWRCGSHACFGGHLTTWPEFKAQGVDHMDESSEPYIKMGNGYAFRSFGVSIHLFGDNLFYTRRSYEAGPDYQIVVRRLENRIVELSELGA